MVGVNQLNPNPGPARTPPSGTPLVQWLHQVIGLPGSTVRIRLRGNTLHVLLEAAQAPSTAEVLPPLQMALHRWAIDQFLPAGSPPIYRLMVYGRALSAAQSAWSESVVIPRPDTIVSDSGSTESTRSLARQGHPGAIARYLSDTLGMLGVSIKVRSELVAPPAHADHQTPRKRLLVLCESPYLPDPLQLSEPIAAKLRDLHLEQYHDALVYGRVAGEQQAEWTLRVDLTPPDVILREWARWGDIQAIAQLLSRLLEPQDLQVSALLKETTLHLTCTSTNGSDPDKLSAVAAITPILEAVAPQGIHSATLYGEAIAPLDEPLWVHWVNLPATHRPDRQATTLSLAQQGTIGAIEFLLIRRLNPDLVTKLTTGGIQVHVRERDHWLYVMTEAVVCPPQAQVAPEILRCLKPLNIPDLAGVTIYGRRAGQKPTMWEQITDFATRSRLVPEATPEFAASDAYVGDLLSSGGSLVATDDRSERSRWWADGLLQGIHRILLKSQCFVPRESEPLTPIPVSMPLRSGALIAGVWGTIGCLAVVQGNWVLGHLVQQTKPAGSGTTPTPMIAPSELLPHLSLNKSKAKPDNQPNPAFNGSGFTRSDPSRIAPPPEPSEANPTTLPASPLQPKALPPGEGDRYPTFNSRQFDEKVAAYKRYLAEQGPPDILIVGSSRALRGVDPTALSTILAKPGQSKVKVFNFGVNGATAQVVDFVLQLIPQEGMPKLILWADGSRAFNSGRPDQTYTSLLESEGYRSFALGQQPIPGTLTTRATEMAKTIAQTKAMGSLSGASSLALSNGYEQLNRSLDHAVTTVSGVSRDRLKGAVRDTLAAQLPKGGPVSLATDSLGNVTTSPAAAAGAPQPVGADVLPDIYGFLPLSQRFNPTTYYQKYTRVPGDHDADYDQFSLGGSQTAALGAIARFSKERAIPLVFVNLPLTRDYLDPARRRYETQFQQTMVKLSQELGFVYRDLSTVMATQPDYFSDPSHLNRYGGYEVSRRLAQDVMIPWNRAR